MSLGSKQGTFAWYSYISNQAPKGLNFYKSLLHWNIPEREVGGHKMQFIEAQGLTFADVESTMSLNRWMASIAVENTDAVAEKAKRLGGSIVKAPYDMKGVGRLAIVADMFGSNIGLYSPEQPARLEGSSMGEKTGQVCWNELMVANPKEAASFYGELFAWKFDTTDMGPMGQYHHFSHNGKGCGGIMKTMPGAEGLANMWIPYLSVVDIQSSTKNAQTLGAKIYKQPTPIPETGLFSVIQDPAGVVSYLFQYTGKQN